MVELPISVPQDHTLLEILEYSPEKTLSVWLDSIEGIKKRKGLALMIVHPDYMLAPERLIIYENFLKMMQQESDCWFALPRDVSRWWRIRHGSQLIMTEDGGWDIRGPAENVGRIVSRVTDD
jgi:hypothetical protein